MSGSTRGRIARSELRDLLLDAGVEILAETGIRTGIEHLTFRVVFARVEEQTGRRITSSSVYERLWVNQADFQWDVLATLIERANAVDARSRLQVEAIAAAADYARPEGRWAALAEICRSAVTRHVSESARHGPQRIVAAAMGAIALTRPAEVVDEAQQARVRRVEAAIARYLENQTSFYNDLYHQVGFYLGLRLKPGLDVRHFTLVAHALGDGIATRLTYFPDYDEPVDFEALPGDPSPWSLAGLGVYAVAATMVELDPDWTPDRLTMPWPGVGGDTDAT
jgi:hypothetical protein